MPPKISKTTLLSINSKKTGILEIEFDDPADRLGVLPKEEVKKVKPSVGHWVGYIVHEDEKCLWLSYGVFEYALGNIDFEDVHVIPKTIIRQKSYLKPAQVGEKGPISIYGRIKRKRTKRIKKLKLPKEVGYI